MDREIGRAEAKVAGATCCNCVALIFAIFATISPFYMWNQNYSPYNTYRTRLGTGPFIVSSTSTQFQCGFGCTGVFNVQTNYWDDFTSEVACSNDTNIYTEWSGKYGFCDKPNGTFSVPSHIRAIQAFVCLTFIFLVFSACAGSSVRVSKSKGVGFAATLSVLSMICAIVSFSLWYSSDWYSDLAKGEGALPFFATSNKMQAATGIQLYHGPAFIGLVVIFPLTLFSTIYFVIAARAVDDELDFSNFDGEDVNLDSEPTFGESGITKA